MARNRYRKINVKKIVGLCLVGALLVGILSSFAVFANDSKPVRAYEFTVGSVSETNGQYVEDKTAVYTKDAIECQGLRIKPKFDSDVTYQIFWYNEDEIYIDCTEKTSMTSTQFVNGVPSLAKYCRIVIYPSQIDENGKQIKDFEVSLFDVSDIVDNLDITVDKKQEFVIENLFENLTVYDENMGTKNEVFLNGDKVIFRNTQFGGSVEVGIDEMLFQTMEGIDLVKLNVNDVAVYKFDLVGCEDVTIVYFEENGDYVDIEVVSGNQVSYVEMPEISENLIVAILHGDIDNGASMTAYLPR